MIPKDEIKELNQNKSPDYMDSLILTFAENVVKEDKDTEIKGVVIERKRK